MPLARRQASDGAGHNQGSEVGAMHSSRRGLIGVATAGALLVGYALPAAGGTATATTAGWTIEVDVADVMWTSTEGCELIPVDVAVSGWGSDLWAVDMSVRHSSAGAESGYIYAYGDSTLPTTVDGQWTTDFQLCPFDSPPGTYLAEGIAEYGYDVDYMDFGRPGSLAAPLSTTFTLSKMPSGTTLNAITSDGDVAQVSGRATADSPKLGTVGWGSARVSLQQYRNGSWQELEYAYTDSRGYFSEGVSGVSAPEAVRAVTGEEDKVLGSTSASVIPGFPAPAPPAAETPEPAASVKVKAKKRKSKLYVDVNPNKGKRYWKFKVQKQRASGSWKSLKTYRTKGKKETRLINLKKGTYRVKVKPKFGYQGVTSAEVYLKR